MTAQPARRTPPDVLVISRVVLDDLHHEDGRADLGVLGGSGFWAAFGASLVSDQVAVTCKVGTDFEPYYPVLDRLGIRSDGLVRHGEHTSRTVVTYPRPGQRHEQPLPNWEAHVAMRTMVEEFPGAVADPGSYYVFRDFHPGFWEHLLDAVRPQVPVLWEIPGSICRADQRNRVKEVLRRTGLLSINREEAAGLTGHSDEVSQLAALHDLGATVVALRRGSRGCVTSDGNTRWWATPPAGIEVVDVTGAGNAFSGAMIAAWQRNGGNAKAATVAAMAASAVALTQVGPPPDQATARVHWQGHLDEIQITAEEW